MHPQHSPPRPATSLTVADVQYIVFRHKGKIIAFALAGMLAAAAIVLLRPPLYRSEAKLLIRYVLETKSMPGVADDAQIRTPDSRGDSIINSELQVLSSWDLALKVADAVGPERILPKPEARKDIYRAAAMLLNGLEVEVPAKSTVIRVSIGHPDPTMPQILLSNLISAYLQKHVQIHRAVGTYDAFLSEQTDRFRNALRDTEQQLRDLKNKARIISVDDSKKALLDAMSRLQQDLFAAEAELAERQGILDSLQGQATNGVASADQQPAMSDTTQARQRVEQYKTLLAQLEALRSQEPGLLSRFTEAHPSVAALRQQIDRLEQQRRQMEQENPQLALLVSTSASPTHAQFDPVAESARLTALQMRIRALTNRLEQIRLEAAGLDAAAPEIRELERKRQTEEEAYREYAKALEQARIDNALGPGKISNVSIVQAPAPPSRDLSELKKPVLIALVLGFGGGIGLALLIELFLDQSLRRPSEIESRLQLPLFLTIPRLSANGRFPASSPKGKLVAATTGPPEKAGQAAVAKPGPMDKLRPFCEALRDRLIMDFQLKNMTHKPKLVAVTSCSKGAGVSSLAGGLAAALSETGDGNVLLVDMNLDQGAAQPYHRGQPACSLADALEHEKRDTALVQENLYVVLARDARTSKPSVLPKQLSNIVPRLKASDYDYIIFDMPPVSQTSVTAKLAGLMDMVLMVVESEKAHRESALRAKRMLAEADASVAVVLNKYRPYVPQKLLPEL